MALKLPKIISQQNVKKMLDQININCPTGIRNYAMIIFMYRSGLRVSEVCNLGLSDVNFETRLIYIQQGKGQKDRYMPMDNDIIGCAKKWVNTRPDGEYFFSTLKGGKLDKRYVREMCYRISKKAGVYILDGKKKKPVNPHMLRHSFATELLREGFTLRQVQEALGHSNVSTTMVYTHVIMDELQDKIQKRKCINT